jgi:hypothetical protein
VNGIWEKYTDTNDINATDTSFPNNTLVSGDDFGLVKLFRFPCIKKGMGMFCIAMTRPAPSPDLLHQYIIFKKFGLRLHEG